MWFSVLKVIISYHKHSFIGTTAPQKPQNNRQTLLQYIPQNTARSLKPIPS